MADGVQHPIHEHELSLRELSEKSKTNCFLCKQSLHGLAYCCLDCDVFLDESCAFMELPLQIQHPSHPEHPLSLDSTTYLYRCRGRGCYVDDLSAVEATATNLPPETEPKEEEERSRIRHFAHEHPLTPLCPTTQNWSTCKACKDRISGPGYGCARCMFFLHEACAQLPQRMQHPFHHQHALALVADFVVDFGECYICRSCHSRSRFVYSCEECSINHCVKCVVSTEAQEMEEGAAAIECFFHKHRLTPCTVKIESKIPCRVCRLYVSGEVYCCFGCAFFVHKACLEELPQEIDHHHLHQEHPLVLRASVPYNEGTFDCASCLQGSNGMTFNCESCKFDLDPHCALQTLSAVKEGTPSEIRHFSHPHPLILVYSSEVVNAIECDGCNESANGLAYCCQTCTFKLMLHKSCAEAAPELEHEFHPQHPMVLLSRAPAEFFYCGACHKKSEGFAFCCNECEFYLDLECAARKPALKHERHEHRLAYFPRSYKANRLCCNSCGKSCNRDLYRCVPCNFNLHHDCLPLPSSIQHEFHPYHPLVLLDKFIDGGLPEYQYCDYCEEIRNPDHGVYHCAECWRTTHIECVIPTVKPEELKPSERAVLDEKEKEIADLEAKIEIMERNLKAKKEKLKELSKKRGYEFTGGIWR